MGNSSTTIQSIVDVVCSMGVMQPVIPASGFGVNSALSMATDTMCDLISERFNWKWNRMKLPPFYTISWQQDYAQIGSSFSPPIGWLEGADWGDINQHGLLHLGHPAGQGHLALQRSAAAGHLARPQCEIHAAAGCVDRADQPFGEHSGRQWQHSGFDDLRYDRGHGSSSGRELGRGSYGERRQLCLDGGRPAFAGLPHSAHAAAAGGGLPGQSD